MTVVMRQRRQQLRFGKECGLWRVWSEGLRLERLEIECRENGDWDWEWDFDLWKSEILRTMSKMGLKTKACMWNCGRLISISNLAVLNFWWFDLCFADLIFAFACKTLDACSSQFDSALVLSSSVSHAHLKRTEIYIFFTLKLSVGLGYTGF